MRFLLAFALLSVLRAQAQQPALSSAPSGPAATTPTALPNRLVTGHHYEVRLSSGVAFTGKLTLQTSETLEFNVPTLGHLVVQRRTLEQLTDLAPTPPPAPYVPSRPGFYDVGSGSRYFISPSGRGLRRGEAELQGGAVAFFVGLGGINYGFTDNFSLGGYVTIIPFLGLRQGFVLAPKASFALAPTLHLGAGVLLGVYPSYDTQGPAGAVGVAYGALTKGSAETNVTLGLGWAFAGEGVPVALLSGQWRVLPKLALVTENYAGLGRNGVAGGLYGMKLHGARVAVGLAAGYATFFGPDNEPGRFYSSYVIPVYADLAYRFGRPYRVVRP